MNFRSIYCGILAASILAGAPAFTASAAAQESGGILGRIGLPGIFGSKSENKSGLPAPAQQPVQMAQAGDPRITALEEQVRQLSGTIEELNFQLLQMQEQLRKMQEDNEFRFQELEKRGDAGGTSKRTVTAQREAPTEAPTDAPQEQPADATASAELPGGVEDGTKLPTGTLGTVIVDPDGTVRNTGQGEPMHPLEGEPMDGHSDGTTVAALPSGDNAEEVYRNSYEFILSGDYSTAEAGFRDHIARFPSDARASDAHYWLGESLLGQQRYRDAAEVFLAANKDYPQSSKAPDMLFKLGVSLSGLNQRDVACATFSEVTKRYPSASDSLKGRLKQEQAAAGC